MPRTLYYLILASGNAASAGQSWRNHVAGSPADGDRMSDWFLDLGTYSGEPSIDAAPIGFPYDDGEVLSVTHTPSRGAKGWSIQRNNAGAYTPVILSGDGEATVSGFSAGGSPAGATHTFNLTLRGPRAATPSPAVVLTQPSGPPVGSSAYQVQCAVTITNGGGGSYAQTLRMQWQPDNGPFNPGASVNWSYYIQGRPWQTSDFEFEWHSNNTYTDLLSTSATFTITTNPPYPTDAAGLFPGETVFVYLRYRRVGDSLWTNYGVASFTDPRDPE